MLEYFIEVYFKIHAYGGWIFLASAAIAILGGLALLLTMADNGEKGSLDFSQDYITARAEQFGSFIVWWKKAVSVFIFVALVAVFAPSETVVSSWTADAKVCKQD